MFRILAAALLVMLSASSPALADGKRVALILGIGEYQHLASLTNPVRDAKAIATELRDHGFEVSEHYNLDGADLLDALETFKRQAQDAEVALVYYAGHGMEIDGKNVVAPTDMEIECANKSTLRSERHDGIGIGAAVRIVGKVALIVLVADDDGDIAVVLGACWQVLEDGADLGDLFDA